MTAKELIDYLKTVDENAEINIVDKHQNNKYRIVDIQTCEDRSSKEYLKEDYLKHQKKQTMLLIR